MRALIKKQLAFPFVVGIKSARKFKLLEFSKVSALLTTLAFSACSENIFLAKPRPSQVGAANPASSSQAPIYQTQSSQTQRTPDQSQVISPLRRELPIPPWQFYDYAEFQDPTFSRAISLELDYRFIQAAEEYRNIYNSSPLGRFKEEALSRELSCLLKTGRSSEVLERIAAHLKETKQEKHRVSPSIGLLAAYSYLHQGNVDQTLAWFDLAYRKSDGRGPAAKRVVDEVQDFLSSLEPAKFNRAKEVWGTDAFYATFIERETQRRRSGGEIKPARALIWFKESTFSRDLGGVDPATLDPAKAEAAAAKSAVASRQSNQRVLGLLLPSSGRYSRESQQIKQGVELALAEYALSANPALSNSQGDKTQAEQGQAGQVLISLKDTESLPASEAYRELVENENAFFVLGPILVKDSEEVARESAKSGRGFISFTRRAGLGNLSPVAFRLGASEQDQITELINYARREFSAKSFGILYPEGDAQAETYKSALRQVLTQLQFSAPYELPYRSSDLDSLTAELSNQRPQLDLIFFADSAEQSAKVIPLVKQTLAYEFKIAGPESWNDPLSVQAYAPELEGAVLVSPFLISSKQAEVSQFVKKFRGRFQEDPGFLAAQAYDASRLVLKASGSDFSNVDSGELLRALKRQGQVSGLTGKLEVKSNGEINRRASVLRIAGGQMVEVMRAGEIVGVY